MAYKRQIAYFDYFEYGEKKGNGGFCKWQQKNEIHTLEISINGLKENMSEKVKIFTKTGGELGELQLHNGCAKAVFTKKCDDGNWDWEFGRIRISLLGEKELVAEFPVERNAQQQMVKVVERNAQQQEEKVEEKNVEHPIEKNEEKNVQKQVEEKPLLQKIEEVVKELAIRKDLKPDIMNAAEQMPEVGRRAEAAPSVVGRSAEMVASTAGGDEEVNILAERQEECTPVSLWEWLEQTHEKIQPFGTREEYFRIMVEDIYRLNEECHVLRNNQFLLHGYYNYKYLILGKKDGNSEEYWLGVPGIYHEREKMAARMYGFEKFEGAKQQYRVGDLGYYLITAK